MSLDAWEQRILDSIADDLTALAPEFASRLSVFNRLTADEQLPEGLQATVKQRRGHDVARRHGRHRGGRAGGAEGDQGPIMMRPSQGGTTPVLPVVAVLAVIIAVAITLAVVLSTTSHASVGTRQGTPCVQMWPVPCSAR